jgi:hypothetical protein
MAKTQNEQRVRFFTPWQIYVASCLGSPLAATWLTVRNHRALQQSERVLLAVGVGLAATIVALAVAFVLPDSMPVAVWPFLYSIGSYFYARRIFGADVISDIAKVRQRGAWWRVVLASFGFFFVLFGITLTLALLFPGLFVSEG